MAKWHAISPIEGKGADAKLKKLNCITIRQAQNEGFTTYLWQDKNTEETKEKVVTVILVIWTFRRRFMFDIKMIRLKHHQVEMSERKEKIECKFMCKLYSSFSHFRFSLYLHIHSHTQQHNFRIESFRRGCEKQKN